MADFITLSCPSCGGHLEITEDIEQFACGYCGNEHVVRRSGGIIHITPVVGAIEQVKEGVDRATIELAIPRIESDISSLKQRREELIDEHDFQPSFINFALLIFGPMILSLGLLSAVREGQFASLLGGLLITIFGIWWFAGYRRTKNKKDKLLEELLIPIDKELSELDEELRKYRDSVSSRKD